MARTPKNKSKFRQKPSPKHRSQRQNKAASPDHDWLYGRHAVLAALANDSRQITRLHATGNALKDFEELARQRSLSPVLATTSELSALLPPGAVHQGIAIKVRPLPEKEIGSLSPDRPVIVLDQVTDPHNVGAILRSAAVFNASALIMTRRNSPPLTGVLAKSACGALEHVDVVFVGNLSKALKDLEKSGFWRIGLDGAASDSLETATGEVAANRPIALVLGAEDKGMRRLTIEHCDQVCHISTTGPLASLNVSNAAAIALHIVSQRNGSSRKNGSNL